MDSIDSLPLFPLSAVLYPGEQLTLHIFEERYLELVRYCLEHDVPFGVVWAEDDEWADVGTTARITDVIEEYDDGRMDIAVRGEERFRIEEVYRDQASYHTADATFFANEDFANEGVEIDLELKERVITQHMKLLELAGQTVRPDLYQNVRRLSFVLAENALLDGEQKQELLELETESERVQYLVHHFESVIPQVEQQEDVKRRIRSNGHFKDFPPEEA